MHHQEHAAYEGQRRRRRRVLKPLLTQAAAHQQVDQAALERSADVFTNQTYPIVHEAFGTEWLPGVDGVKLLERLAADRRPAFLESLKYEGWVWLHADLTDGQLRPGM